MRRARPGLQAGLIIVSAALLLALAGLPWGDPARSALTRFLGVQDPEIQDRTITTLPSPQDDRHLLGTDTKGRDVLSRLLHGARVSVFVGLSAEAVALACGILVGLVAGYAGGRLDALMMRGTDVLLALPLPLLAMGAMVVFRQRSVVLVFMVLGLLGWGGIARLIRAEILSLRTREFAEAARALGARDGRIALLHLLPHALTPALALATAGIAGNILTEAWLSFLGISTSAETPTWGKMIYEARTFLDTHARLSILPGLALAVTTGGFFLLADGLRETLDPARRAGIHGAPGAKEVR